MSLMAGDPELVPVGTAPTLIIEPREVTAAGLESVLRRNGIAVAGIARDGSEGIGMASATKPSVVLLDVNLPDMSAVRTAKQILKQGGHIRVLALADGTDEAIVGRFLLAGVHGPGRVGAASLGSAPGWRRSSWRSGGAWRSRVRPGRPEDVGPGFLPPAGRGVPRPRAGPGGAHFRGGLRAGPDRGRPIRGRRPDRGTGHDRPDRGGSHPASRPAPRETVAA